MKILRVLLIILLVSITFGCASTGKGPTEVVYDYNVNADFSSLKTYDWLATSGGVKINQLVIMRVKDAVDTKLQARGLALSKDDPDFLITMYGETLREYETKWKGLDSNLWNDEGRIKLAFFDSQTNEVIWWAETRADVYLNMPPEEKTKMVNDAVSRMLEKFPPNPPE